MFCNKCGKEINKGSKFCNFCGNKIRLPVKNKIVNDKVYIEREDESDDKYVWTCDYCGKEFSTESESDTHEKECDKNPVNKKNIILCSKCGTENFTEAKFCKKCGNEMDKNDFKYAGFWVRFGAWLIDYAGVLFFSIILYIILAILGFDPTNMDRGLDVVLTYIYMVLYFTFFIATWSTTPGKRIYGLKVVNEDGNKVSWSMSFKRALLQPLSTFLFGAGYTNMNKNGKEQAWHDRKSHTIVTQKEGVNYFFPIILSILGFIIYAWVRSLSNT